MVLGRTFRSGDHTLWGFHGGYAANDVDTRGRRNTSDIDTWQIGLHASHATEDFYVDGVLGYSRSDIDSQRFINFTGTEVVARGDRDGDEAFAYAELGKVMDLDDDGDEENLYLQPQLALQYRHSSEDAFTETGAGAANLSVAGRDTDSFQTALGARVFKTCKLDSGGWLVPDLRLRWGHEFADVDSTVRASFVGTPQVFQISGRQRDRDTLQVRAGVTGYTVRNLDFDLGYYGEFGDGQQNHAGVLRVVRAF